MNTRRFLLLICISFLSPILCRAQQQAPDEVWIAVTVADRGADQPGNEYLGSVTRQAFNDILNAAAPACFIKLNHVAEMSAGGRIIPLSEVHSVKDAKLGYSRVMYFRAENIFRIIELDPQFVKDNIFELTDKK